MNPVSVFVLNEFWFGLCLTTGEDHEEHWKKGEAIFEEQEKVCFKLKPSQIDTVARKEPMTVARRNIRVRASVSIGTGNWEPSSNIQIFTFSYIF
jgi:hypothetical protein